MTTIAAPHSRSDREAPSLELKPAGPCVLVVFGVTGDLARRLLFPALYNLRRHNLLPEQFAIAGFALSELSDEQLRAQLVDHLKQAVGPEADADSTHWLASRVRYVASDFESPAGWERLRSLLAEVDSQYRTGGNYLFYLATAPEFFLVVTRHLAHVGLLNDSPGHWRRIVVEKPFGHDLQSARELNRELLKLTREDQIYRIDHYLGKETVQNIMVMRFANGVFEPIWNRRYIDHVQITVAESAGIDRRGRYYDRTGALRDMVPNHLAHVLALTAMEPASSFSPPALQNEQVKILESVPPLNPEECSFCVVRGQYTRGIVDGTPVSGYHEEMFVPPDSQTETYVAMKIAVDTWRWAGVPFYLRTGKRLRRRNTEVVIQFRNPPLALFRRSGASLPQPNSLVIGIQPEENIRLEFEAKKPGPRIETSSATMQFDYRLYFGAENRTGYETLLDDAMIGDSSLFKRADMIEAGWAIVQPILNAWAEGRGGPVHPYPAGSNGPESADALIQSDGRAWRPL
jgi:glucose-6-phosphate 1-dehydrogenase